MLVACLLLSLAVGSLASCPASIHCFRKCCSPGTKLSQAHGCVPTTRRFDVPDGTDVIIYRPSCDLYYLDPALSKYNVHYNGTLVINHPDTVEITTKFCMDEFKLSTSAVFVCVPGTEEDEETYFRFYSLGLFFSAPFLLATAVVYAFLSNLRTLHSCCVVIHSLCLFASCMCLGLLQIGFFQHSETCAFLGYAIQFFFMATFFWLNVMCFDIYWAFSGLRNLTGSVKERERKKLILYSIYAWCTPLLILIITVAVDLSPSVPANSIFKPQVGVDKCFFREQTATWIYFYLPMALIILSNIFLFTVTAYRIWSHRKEAAVLKRGDSRKHDSTNDKERFSLYLKLFIVMGINWVMELLSSIVGGPSYLWYIPDFTNTLQGVFIFIIFVWKKRVRRLVRAKIYACLGKKMIPSDTSNGSTRNTNSSDASHTNNSIKMTPTTQSFETTVP